VGLGLKLATCQFNPGGGPQCSPLAGPNKPFKIFTEFSNSIQPDPNYKLGKQVLPWLQKISNFAGWKITSSGITFLLGIILNSQQNLN
jgi:hypothetical protein